MYYDISYRKTQNGPLNIARRADWDDAMEFLHSLEGNAYHVLISTMEGELPNLPDKEVG